MRCKLNFLLNWRVSVGPEERGGGNISGSGVAQVCSDSIILGSLEKAPNCCLFIRGFCTLISLRS